MVITAAGCTSAASPDRTTTAPSAGFVQEPPGVSSIISTPTTASTIADLSGALGYEIIATYPHDSNAYTQGLELHNGSLYESTGLYGESDRRIVDLVTGEVVDLEPLPDEVFGEGITVVGDELYQLSWRSRQVFVSDVATLDAIRILPFDTEGWGLCNTGATLALSNGTATISFRDPANFATLSSITVTINGVPLESINELECVGERIFANVFQSASIVVIDQATGVVEATADLTALLPNSADTASGVLNGIAYRAETDTFLVTGKRWDTVYELRLFAA